MNKSLNDFIAYVNSKAGIENKEIVIYWVEKFKKSFELPNVEASRVSENEQTKEVLHDCLLDNSCKSYGTSKCTPKCKLYQ